MLAEVCSLKYIFHVYHPLGGCMLKAQKSSFFCWVFQMSKLQAYSMPGMVFQASM